ncbi:MAG TPA: Os1348 family NHLP clan protein [Vicinamibacterales bacterium]|nr:Os1348 family NHLP clan protein [Vicinamibacterales bacterium]
MSQKTVQLIIGRILTDEELRQKFLVSPVETLSSFRESGLELTDAEIDALTSTDRTLWKDGANRIDSRLQRCCLTRSESGSS